MNAFLAAGLNALVADSDGHLAQLNARAGRRPRRRAHKQVPPRRPTHNGHRPSGELGSHDGVDRPQRPPSGAPTRSRRPRTGSLGARAPRSTTRSHHRALHGAPDEPLRHADPEGLSRVRGQRLRPRTHPEDSPQQVVEQGNDRLADEERDSDSGVQESDVRTASARQQRVSRPFTLNSQAQQGRRGPSASRPHLATPGG